MMKSKLAGLAVPLLALTMTTACSSGDGDAAATGDSAYVFDAVQNIRELHIATAMEPQSLAEALPNRPVDGDSTITWSDLVLTGKVIDVQPGTAVEYTHPEPGYEGDEEQFREVDFVDPRAHDRNVVITVKPDWSAGQEAQAEVKVRMGVLGGADPLKFVQGLLALKDATVVMVLDARESGRHSGDYYPIMNGALLGQVTSDGHLSFTGLGDQEAAFLGELDTVAELRAQAESVP